MTTIISVFNNKGGVGKTTYLFHIGHILARNGKTVLLVDLDTQGNLTNYCLSDTQVEQSWAENGNSIYRVVEPVIRGTGDIFFPVPTDINYEAGSIYLVPGDLRLSDFEDLLGDTWNAARGGAEAQVRTQTALFRYISYAAEAVGADIVLIDMGPNLGALNRAALACSDYFVMPVAPDLFSIQGTQNLGNKLVAWRSQWQQVHDNWTGEGVALPKGAPLFLGYVVQMHNVRNNAEKMTRGWSIYGKRIENAVSENIVKMIGPDQVVRWNNGSHRLGEIPNLHSLVPYSQEAKKPIFDCTGADGLRGAHQTKAKESIDLFGEIIDAISEVL